MIHPLDTPTGSLAGGEFGGVPLRSRPGTGPTCTIVLLINQINGYCCLCGQGSQPSQQSLSSTFISFHSVPIPSPAASLHNPDRAWWCSDPYLGLGLQSGVLIRPLPSASSFVVCIGVLPPAAPTLAGREPCAGFPLGSFMSSLWSFLARSSSLVFPDV